MKLIIKKINKISLKEKNEIINLKNQEWKYTYKKQNNWIKKNIKKNDINIFLKINKKIVGYNLLRLRKFQINQSKTAKYYFYFDTLIIDKEFRNKNLSNIIMKKSIEIISRKAFGFLVCKKNLIKFYKRYGWKQCDRTNFKITNKKTKFNFLVLPKKERGLFKKKNKVTLEV